MATIAETLRAIEARAERAIVQELRQMAKDVLAMRPLLLKLERNHADALMLKLLRLARTRLVAPVNPSSASNASGVLMPTLRYGEEPSSTRPAPYKVYLYDREYGDLEDVITLEAFDICVQLVRDRLDLSVECVVQTAWVNGAGALTVLTPRGNVLARIEAASNPGVAVHPVVRRACQALQAGDTSRLDRLFGVMLKAA
jgi:hypothetical protein